MMRSESTRAFGQPSETKLTFGAAPSLFGAYGIGSAYSQSRTRSSGSSFTVLCVARAGLSAVSPGFGLGVEALFPGAVIVRTLANERREDRKMEQQPVHEIGREA